MTLRAVYMTIKAYDEELERNTKELEFKAWLYGKYTCEAIVSTVGNMFRGKSGKVHEYPGNPFNKPLSQKTEEEITEDDKLEYANKLMTYFAVQQANFELSKQEQQHDKEG